MGSLMWDLKPLQQNLVHTRTQAKGSVTPQGTEPDVPVSVGESPEEVRVGSGLPREQGHQQQQSWEVTLGVSPLGDRH